MTEPVPSEMRAVSQPVYADPPALRVVTVPVPRPAAGEVLVRVQATPVSRSVWHLATGRPYLARLAGC